MRATLAMLALLFLVGCATPPPKGGNASQSVPALATQHLTQPEAPDGTSRQFYAQTVTEHRVDGTVVVTRTEAQTELGGSQDWVAAIKASGIAANLRGIILALLLVIAAIVAYAREWPVLAALLATGALMVAMYGVWAGLAPAAAGLTLYLGYQLRGKAFVV